MVPPTKPFGNVQETTEVLLFTLLGEKKKEKTRLFDQTKKETTEVLLFRLFDQDKNLRECCSSGNLVRERERELFQNSLEKQIHSKQISKISLLSTSISAHTNNSSKENDSSLFSWGSHDRKIEHCLYWKKNKQKKKKRK